MTKRLILRGLDCPNCAMKIERGVAAVEGVASAQVDFTTQALVYTPTEGFAEEGIRCSIEEIVRALEPDVVVEDAEDARRDRNHAHDHTHDSVADRATIVRLVAGAVLLAVGLLLPSGVLRLPLFFASYLIVGYKVLLTAGRNIVRGRVFDENLLMTVASIGAFALGEYPEGAAVMLFYEVGELFQDYAVARSRRSIAALTDIRPDVAYVRRGDALERIAPEHVAVGDVVVVRPGERVPLDGVIVSGHTSFNTSALTGESLPREAEVGDEVLSGFISVGGVADIRVTRPYAEGAVSRILRLVEEAGARKAPTERFITRFARYYTPVVTGAALLLAILPPLLVPGATFAEWTHRALTFLVASCPCALVISVPLSFFGGIGGASRRGILIKGGNYLEALARADTVAFDKTGTLTRGVFSVTEIVPSGMDAAALLDIAACAEAYSAHPIARSIADHYGMPVDLSRVSEYREQGGMGATALVDGVPVLAGGERLMRENGISPPDTDAHGAVVHVARGGVYAGRLHIADTVKPGSAQAIIALRDAGVRRVVMLTGDAQSVADTVAEQLGLDSAIAQLLPEGKVAALESLATGKKGGSIIFVGDGVNDAPVLARADVGVAMGALGSAAAIEAADVVIMDDDPRKLANAIAIARKTRSIVRQNIALALTVKAVVLALGAMGLATMWAAVFADVGVALLAVLNAMRALRAGEWGRGDLGGEAKGRRRPPAGRFLERKLRKERLYLF